MKLKNNKTTVKDQDIDYVFDKSLTDLVNLGLVKTKVVKGQTLVKLTKRGRLFTDLYYKIDNL